MPWNICVSGWLHNWRRTNVSVMLVIITDSVGALPLFHYQYFYSHHFLRALYTIMSKKRISNVYLQSRKVTKATVVVNAIRQGSYYNYRSI